MPLPRISGPTREGLMPTNRIFLWLFVLLVLLLPQTAHEQNAVCPNTQWRIQNPDFGLYSLSSAGVVSDIGIYKFTGSYWEPLPGASNGANGFTSISPELPGLLAAFYNPELRIAPVKQSYIKISPIHSIPRPPSPSNWMPLPLSGSIYMT
jgi:hypothetical protein